MPISPKRRPFLWAAAGAASAAARTRRPSSSRCSPHSAGFMTLAPAVSQHLGLVVMDEAFSKLSGDGVEDCLDLARNFQLQLVMAFPIDRLGVMAPYADTVIVCRKEEQRARTDTSARVDNIPIVLPPDQVMEALE